MTERRGSDRVQVFNLEGFNQFWASYPVKIGKLAAIREWNKLKPSAALVTQMLETLAWQKVSKNWRDGFIPHPRTWIFQGRYLDEAPSRNGNGHAAAGCAHTPRCLSTHDCATRHQMDQAVTEGRVTQAEVDRYLARKRGQL